MPTAEHMASYPPWSVAGKPTTSHSPSACYFVQPWWYDRQAYEAAVTSADPLTPLARLTGEPSATPWDPGLAAAMRHRNVRVEEELTLDALLRDLVP